MKVSNLVLTDCTTSYAARSGTVEATLGILIERVERMRALGLRIPKNHPALAALDDHLEFAKDLLTQLSAFDEAKRAEFAEQDRAAAKAEAL